MKFEHIHIIPVYKHFTEYHLNGTQGVPENVTAVDRSQQVPLLSFCPIFLKSPPLLCFSSFLFDIPLLSGK